MEELLLWLMPVELLNLLVSVLKDKFSPEKELILKDHKVLIGILEKLLQM
jgi:hypothetical protein